MVARTAAFAAGGNAARRHEDAWRSFRCRDCRGTRAAAFEPPGESWLSLVGPADTISVDEKMGNSVHNESGDTNSIFGNGWLVVLRVVPIAGHASEPVRGAANHLAA